MKRLSFNGKRLGAGILLVTALFCVANYYFQWQIFGRFNKEVMIAIFVVMFIYLLRVCPTLEEIQDYRNQKQYKDQAPTGFRPRVYFLTCLAAMLILVLIGPVFRLAQGEPVRREDWVELIIVEVLVVVAAIVGWYPTRRLLGRKPDDS